MVSPVIEKLSDKYNGKLKVVKVNVDENQELAMKFGIMSIPTIMLFKNGKELDKAIGAAPSEVLRKNASEKSRDRLNITLCCQVIRMKRRT